MNKRTPLPGYRLLSSPSTKLKLKDSHYETPCNRVNFLENWFYCIGWHVLMVLLLVVDDRLEAVHRDLHSEGVAEKSRRLSTVDTKNNCGETTVAKIFS